MSTHAEELRAAADELLLNPHKAGPELAKPLRRWLKGAAIRHDESDCPWCPNPVGPCGPMADALAVARAITGRPQ